MNMDDQKKSVKGINHGHPIGFNKISLTLAFLVLFPGFVFGFNFHRNEFGIKSITKLKSGIARLYAIPGADDNHIQLSIFFRIGLGLSSGLASSLIVLYGIRGSGCLVRWVAGGFGRNKLKKENYSYWQKVIDHENKIFISLQQQTVEAFGTKGIIKKWGTYYKFGDKYYVVVDKNNHQKMLGKKWKKSIEEIVENGGWQVLIDESNRQKERVKKILTHRRKPAWFSQKR